MSRFSKKERLSSKKNIQELFEKGSSFHFYPFKIFYLPFPNPLESTPPLQVLFSVPKRNHRKAVARNKIKRRLKEAYRLNKNLILSEKAPTVPYVIAYVYLSKDIMAYKDLENKLISSIKRFVFI